MIREQLAEAKAHAINAYESLNSIAPGLGDEAYPNYAVTMSVFKDIEDDPYVDLDEEIDKVAKGIREDFPGDNDNDLTGGLVIRFDEGEDRDYVLRELRGRFPKITFAEEALELTSEEEILLATKLSQFSEVVKEKGCPDEISISNIDGRSSIYFDEFVKRVKRSYPSIKVTIA